MHSIEVFRKLLTVCYHSNLSCCCFLFCFSPSSLQISGNLTVPWITGCSRKRAVSIFPFKYLMHQVQEWEVYLNAFLEISSPVVVHSIIFFLPHTSFLEIVSFFWKAPSHYHLMTFSNIKQAVSALEYSFSSWLRWFHNTSWLKRRNFIPPTLSMGALLPQP